ncbi:MAG: dTMP kinase [Gemmatimonadales bacterium]|nr:dTMP kinase [Gemmatimonadales bacterium]MBA3555053.1 dTMP kinase [Gemmatimonadales bacterium]
MNRPGLFLVLEGSEGSGKSTLLGPLADRIRESGEGPVVVREPGATRAAEFARQALLDPDHTLGPVSELFFYLAARADLVQTVIRPALAAGRVVLSDRFALSTEAYQMAGRGLPAEVVLPANRAAADGLVPDLTLILDLPPAVGQARQVAAGKRLDRLDRESAEFHRRVIDYYLAVRGDGVRHLDGSLPPDRLLQAAWVEVLAVAPERFAGAGR